MKFLFIYCEGKTEEAFVERILAPYFKEMNVFVTPSKPKGVSNFETMKKDLTGFCLSYPNSLVTTMIDYYGLQKIIPRLIPSEGDIYKRAQTVEENVKNELQALNNLYFNMILHEFEGLLFSDINAFEGIASKSQLLALRNTLRRADNNPERINDKYETAPSRRILEQIPEYSKIRNGVEIAQRIGVTKIADECQHFRQWIGRLSAWAKGGSMGNGRS